MKKYNFSPPKNSSKLKDFLSKLKDFLLNSRFQKFCCDCCRKIGQPKKSLHYVLLCRCFAVLSQEFVTISVNHNCILHYLHSSQSLLFSSECQVWPLTQFFFCFLFVKNHWFAWRANHWPLIGENTILCSSSQQLPRLCLGPELTRRRSRALALLGLSTRLVRCFRNYRDTRTLSGVAC